ncbi:hypothetical protein Goklo_021286 [Gossypium klotzschianum]|uniref:RNase H type-1 domain-containing protein n=1 Tax=Gossypium klotzschianum TaxID=34286 RepID=A0A7J8UUM6_9ROSI|nr:hypothetical protein [Gossypium klotzschianum]
MFLSIEHGRPPLEHINHHIAVLKLLEIRDHHPTHLKKMFSHPETVNHRVRYDNIRQRPLSIYKEIDLYTFDMLKIRDVLLNYFNAIASWTKSLNTNDFSQAWKATSSLKGWWKLPDIRWARDNVDGSVSTVEARAMLEGLKIAWVRSFRQVEVESDNALLVDILRNGLTGTNSVVEVRMIHTWVSKNLQVRYKLISRDSNRLADCITNEATGN